MAIARRCVETTGSFIEGCRRDGARALAGGVVPGTYEATMFCTRWMRPTFRNALYCISYHPTRRAN